MGRHSAPRRHGPVVVLGVAAVLGSAGVAWAVGGGSAGGPEPDAVPASSTSRLGTLVPAPVTTSAPTPSTTAGTPLVRVVPVPTPATTSAGTPWSATTPTASSPAPTSSPTPTRTKPGRGVVPTPKPSKTPK